MNTISQIFPRTGRISGLVVEVPTTYREKKNNRYFMKHRRACASSVEGFISEFPLKFSKFSQNFLNIDNLSSIFRGGSGTQMCQW